LACEWSAWECRAWLCLEWLCCLSLHCDLLLEEEDGESDGEGDEPKPVTAVVVPKVRCHTTVLLSCDSFTLNPPRPHVPGDTVSHFA
jgi:hypothetical protein